MVAWTLSTYYEQLPGRSAPALILHVRLPWLACCKTARMIWNATSSLGNAQGKTSLFLWKGTTAYIWPLPELSFTIRVAIGAVLHHFHERAEMPSWYCLSTTL